ncbi:hypothetical protein [Amedibacillus hominis]|uniref:HlyD family secretion protein n=1 Tax=Amedibacillus hominis TaxID=2897776 RepID=A0ABS9RCH5_9FIRM|nr:hypothetical protein [Amedibacillus hominis]MCH4287363.1 hypothetical protein [Amedibacillus hominis]
MSDMHFKVPSKDAIKSKMISALCLALIILSLYTTYYLLFFRTTGVDITKDIEILYRGEDGSGVVSVRNKNLNYNQRIQEFMDTVEYKVTPNKNLKNGDKIKISTTYDETLASRYHINAINVVKEVTVEGLPVRYENVKQIPQTLLDEVKDNSKKYLEKNMSSILSDDFTAFYFTSEPELENYRFMYRIFLNAKDDESKDKILDIYSITAKGEVNVSNKEEKLETKDETIYYMITYNEINTSGKILKEDIYGEKIIVSGKQNLQKEKDFKNYMSHKYGKQYTIEKIE